MNARALAVGLALAWTSAASAEEAIRTAGPDLAVAQVPAPAPIAPLAASPLPDRSAQEIGEWARRVLAGEPTADAQKPDRPRCLAPPDRKPHGEVWAGIGTHGYREIGGVVTQPIGDCGQVTIAISHTEADFDHHARR